MTAHAEVTSRLSDTLHTNEQRARFTEEVHGSSGVI